MITLQKDKIRAVGDLEKMQRWNYNNSRPMYTCKINNYKCTLCYGIAIVRVFKN